MLTTKVSVSLFLDLKNKIWTYIKKKKKKNTFILSHQI